MKGKWAPTYGGAPDFTVTWGWETGTNAGDRMTYTLTLMATHGYTYVPQSLPLDKGLVGHVARTGQPVLRHCSTARSSRAPGWSCASALSIAHGTVALETLFSRTHL